MGLLLGKVGLFFSSLQLNFNFRWTLMSWWWWTPLPCQWKEQRQGWMLRRRVTSTWLPTLSRPNRWEPYLNRVDMLLLGWSPRECHWLVSLSPWLRMLALGNWCFHTDAQPKLPGLKIVFNVPNTENIKAMFQDPFVAIVVDPIRTISAGKVNLGAFRTYPKGYKPPDDNASEYQTIPLNKIEDFGVHCKQYYRYWLCFQQRC